MRPLIQATNKTFLSGRTQAINDDAHWPSQFSKTADQIYGFQQDHDLQCLDRKPCSLSERALPSLPSAARWDVDTIKAGALGRNSENIGVNNLRVSTGRAHHEYYGDEVV